VALLIRYLQIRLPAGCSAGYPRVTVTARGRSSPGPVSGTLPVPNGPGDLSSPYVLRFQAMEHYALSGGREGYERLRVLAAAQRASTLELFRLAVRRRAR
jgi:hypothetical protein